MKILVTGASGFVGRNLCDMLSKTDKNTYALLRNPCLNLNVKDQFVVKDYLKYDEWGKILNEIDVVIHTAGLAHVKGRPDKDYYDINTEMTKKLALECVKAGVKRFVFVSSVAVYGISSSPTAINLSTPVNPVTPYGRSKALAEQFLQDLHAKGVLEVVIVRPPVVYGVGGPGNVNTLMKAIKYNMPMPFAGVTNRRSMIYIDNLCHALANCALNPLSSCNVFLVSDDQDISTEYLVKTLAHGLNKSSKIFYFPIGLLRGALKLIGREETLDKVIGSLELDISDIKKTLNWKPINTVEDGLVKTARSFT